MKPITPILALSLLAPMAYAEAPVFTQGFATTIDESLIECGNGSRPSGLGQIKSEDGSVWTVPAAINFERAHKATDLYNECGGTQLSNISELDLSSVPLLDAGGSEEFTMYIFADNYFELYANGKLLAVDPVLFTPFNSNVVRFKADRPLNLAVMAVDWEENLGLGTEANRGTDFHPGDGGFVAVLKDAAGNIIDTTDQNWKAQTFYTSPLNTKECLQVNGETRDSSACLQKGVTDGSDFFAAHWAIPQNWMTSDFNDSNWPAATEYTNDTIGVNNKKAYTNFVDIFDDSQEDAKFIWSSNVILDNVVLLRNTVE